MAVVAAAPAPAFLPGVGAGAVEHMAASDARLAAVTAVGTHNTHDQPAYPYLTRAVDAGGSLIELDTWSHPAAGAWTVSHRRMAGNDDNCVAARTTADLRTGADDRDLGTCLDGLRIWLDAHPGHEPIVVKIELKNGFAQAVHRGPAALDTVIARRLGDHVYRPPADLLRKPDQGSYPTLDAAVQADNWPTRAEPGH
ncbi:hypothetical protein GT354_23655 [Streptomyces sp. SID3343]|nr:hypothetical protein [Streptomyces sp. SID3343]